MSRGNRGDRIFEDDKDHEVFLDTLKEACERTGWRVHAFILMGNHYHLALETPEANLVVGMKWLQGTYTQRFNARHKVWGHLLQGRYKALIIDPEDSSYFNTVVDYIHLNPARARLFNLEEGRLSDYPWSSYSLYLRRRKRPEWLEVDRLFGSYQVDDDERGRAYYRRHMRKRVLEIACAEKPWEVDERWKAIRRGWCLGDESFKKKMTAEAGKVMKVSQRSSFSGEEAKLHGEQQAERFIREGMKVLRLNRNDLKAMKKSAEAKKALAWLVRKHTAVSNTWIGERLQMGSATNLSKLVREMDEGKGSLGPLKKKMLN